MQCHIDEENRVTFHCFYSSESTKTYNLLNPQQFHSKIQVATHCFFLDLSTAQCDIDEENRGLGAYA